MPIKKQAFASRCQFYVVDGQMHGRARIGLRGGGSVLVQTQPGHGVPMSLLTHALAMRQTDGSVGGLFSDVWNQARKTAKSVATGKVTIDLMGKAKSVAMSDLGAAALSFVPGGTAALTAVKLGTQAAEMLEQASRGEVTSRIKIQRVTALAKKGHPPAVTAHNILKAVYAKGKLKGVYSTGQTKRPATRKQAVARTVLSRVPVRKVPYSQQASVSRVYAPRGGAVQMGHRHGFFQTGTNPYRLIPI